VCVCVCVCVCVNFAYDTRPTLKIVDFFTKLVSEMSVCVYVCMNVRTYLYVRMCARFSRTA
jgi:hypothetical protein